MCIRDSPETVQVKVTPMHGGQGYVCPISLAAYQAAEKGFEIAFGKKPLAVRRGGSIPIISTFEQVWNQTLSIRRMRTSHWIFSGKALKL